MRTRSLVVAALCAAAVGALGAGSAFAGEVTGTGDETAMRDNAQSICGFSGLNDTYSGDPGVPDEDGFTLTQSWGQIPHEVRGELPEELHPGNSCNGHTGFLAGGGEE